MLTIRAEGDKHPKQFFLVTDDANAELVRIQDILEEVDDGTGNDPLLSWFEEHSAGEFEQGVEIPNDAIGEFGDLIENEWPDAWQVIEDQRQDHMRQVEESMSED